MHACNRVLVLVRVGVVLIKFGNARAHDAANHRAQGWLQKPTGQRFREGFVKLYTLTAVDVNKKKRNVFKQIQNVLDAFYLCINMKHHFRTVLLNQIQIPQVFFKGFSSFQI